MAATGTGDIDFSSLWTWTVPLWGLALLVLFLGGVITYSPIIMTASAAAAAPQSGGARRARL